MYCYPLPLSLKGINVPPQGDSNLLGNPSLLLMGVVVKGEGDSSIPRSLQHRVLQPPLVSAVLPLGEVRGAVRALRRGPDLVAIHAATTLDPGTEAAQGQCRVPQLVWLMGCLKMQPSNIWIASVICNPLTGLSDSINCFI